MSFEETAASNSSTSANHISDWLDGSISLLPAIYFDDPYSTDNISTYQWLDQDQFLLQEHLINDTNISTNTNNTSMITPTSSSTIPDHPPPSDSSNKKRKTDDLVPRASQNHHWRKNQSRRINETEEGKEVVVGSKRSVGNKRNTSKSTGNNCNNSNNKEERWAEKLLNPCAVAIKARDSTRVQHLLYVLYELMSPTGDANYRLAFYGFQGLTRYLSYLSSSSASPIFTSTSPITFASLEPRFFQKCLLNFHDRSPWFAFPNNIANSSILQILDQEPENTDTLHILDIGVSHGVQWPTLLEALTRRSNGPPPLVRLTIVAPAVEDDHNTETPFSVGPPGDCYSTQLLGFAKSMNINLQINRLDNHPLQNLNGQVISTSPEETLIICTQFRLHHLNHKNPDERTEFLRMLRSLEPKGVILSENNMGLESTDHQDFATGFSQQVEYLWRFLDSTSSAFKGRESEERRVIEGEAAKVLTNKGEMNEGKEKWCERMREAGFVGEAFGEDAIDGAKALLRKYDNHWEMRVEDKDGCVGLWWKGQPVSFCSLWKRNLKVNDS